MLKIKGFVTTTQDFNTLYQMATKVISELLASGHLTSSEYKSALLRVASIKKVDDLNILLAELLGKKE